jgi:hypothetical protein
MSIESPRKGVVTVARDGVLEAVGRSTASIWLVSPFLSRPITTALIDRAPKGDGVERRFLTALTQRSVEAGVLDPEALALLEASGWELRSIPNLHAKAVVCDGREALIGSGNLTVGGLGGGNLELGSWLPTKDVSVVARHLDSWWSEAVVIDEQHLEQASSAQPKRARSSGWVVGHPLKVDEGDELRATRHLRERRDGGRWWLKAMYHETKDSPDWWVRQPWINDAHGRTNDGGIRYTLAGEPARRPTYRRGDFVVLYLVGPGVLPAIYVVKSTPRFDIEFVKAYWPKDAGTYGWVTDVELVLRADPKKAPQLSATGIPGQALQGGKKRLTESEYTHIRQLIEAAS